MKRIICLTTFMLLASLNGFANIAGPQKTPKPGPKPKSVSTIMSIRLDRRATEAKLLIPKKQIKELRAALDDLDQDEDVTTAAAGSYSRTQTIVSGMFLSLAFVFGGMWFVRSGRAASSSGKGLVVAAVVAGIGSAATFAYANAGPPPEASSITGKMFTEAVHSYKQGSGKITLETKTEGDYIELIVPDPPREAKPTPSDED